MVNDGNKTMSAPTPWWEQPRAVEDAADVERLKHDASALLAALRKVEANAPHDVSCLGDDLGCDCYLAAVYLALAQAEKEEAP